MRKLGAKTQSKTKPDEPEWGALSIFYIKIMKLNFSLLKGASINGGNFQIEEIVFLSFYNLRSKK